MSPPLQPFLDKLEGHVSLSPADCEALLALPQTVRTVRAGVHIFREGERGLNCSVVVSGYLCRYRTLRDGARQIVSVHMKGDGVDIQNALLPLVDYNIQAMTPAEVVMLPATAVSELIAKHPNLARALWIETLVDAAIQREWTVNVGRRDARTRIAHLLCELGVRTEAAGVGKRDCYELPFTQEHLADATGLTPVHVNRTIQTLRADGLVGREKRVVAIGDRQALEAVGTFSPDYLNPRAYAS